MGIKPTSGDHVVIPPDNTQSRWGEWEAELDDKGEVAGEVLSETWALANSANTWITGNSTPLYDGISGALDEARLAYEQADEAWEEAVKARDDAQDEAIKLLAEVQDLQTQQSVRMITVPSTASSMTDGRISVSKSGGKWAVTKIGSWAGSGTAHGRCISRRWRSFGSGVAEYINFDVPVILSLNFSGFQTSWTTDASTDYDFVVYYTVQHGVAKRDKREIGSSVMTNEWATLDTFDAPSDSGTRLTGRFRVTWDAADRGVYYGMRIVVNGEVVDSEYRNGIGPFLPIGNGVVSRSLMIDENIPAGATVEFQARANGGGTSQRTMRSAVVELGWVE